MRRRSRLIRSLTLALAALQLVAPAVSSLAHAFAAAELPARPVAHVEATTSSTCPQLHAIDCAVCRYLTPATTAPADAPTLWLELEPTGVADPGVVAASRVADGLPRGRSPPLA